LISTQHGRGTYIWETPSEESMAQLRHQSLDGLARRYLNEAARLGISPEEVMVITSKYVNEWKDSSHPPLPDLD
jgi:DNA-binding transcriptional regulator YhcF (GntR family)